MSIPTDAGRIDRVPGKSVVQLALEQTQITCWADVDRFLRDQGHTAPWVRAATTFYETDLAREFSQKPRSALIELLGIDFSFSVERVSLFQTQKLATFVQSSAWLGSGRPNEGRVRLDGRAPLALHIGGFFTEIGTDPGRLGISLTGRRGVHVRVLQPVPALKSRASGIVDVWTDRPAWSSSGTPHLAGGGGVQFRIPRHLAGSDEYFAIL